ncbi:MAG: GNAT family N-acetyltransferase [Pseudomonadota bacterium]|nr:GNAT family N-acetyltransferase [Pseudomonadota bacterium]
MTVDTHVIDCIMQVMEAAFDPAYGEAWNRRQISDALTMPSTHALVIGPDGAVIGDGDKKPAGFVLSRHAAGEEELLLIAVDPEYRKSGLGKALIELLFNAASERGATRIYLEMRKGNPAVHLYRKVGFEPIGERPDYYCMKDGSRVDAITFGCSI